jgi:hypothetical protein
MADDKKQERFERELLDPRPGWYREKGTLVKPPKEFENFINPPIESRGGPKPAERGMTRDFSGKEPRFIMEGEKKSEEKSKPTHDTTSPVDEPEGVRPIGSEGWLPDPVTEKSKGVLKFNKGGMVKHGSSTRISCRGK